MASRQARVTSTDTDSWLESEQLIDPRAPRFGQAITFLLLLAGIGYRQPMLIYAVAALLVGTVGSRFQVEPYHRLWEGTLERVLRPPRQRTRAAPFRFAQLLNACLLVVASGAIIIGRPLLGNALAGLAAILAGLSVTTGFCLGCSLYRRFDGLLGGR
jgi:hypothetical protein